jgi:acetoin utilization deacetylase AcuC-like enzyme
VKLLAHGIKTIQRAVTAVLEHHVSKRAEKTGGPMRLAIAYDEAFLDHVSWGYHPERPERLLALTEAIKQAGYWDESRHVEAREATIEELARIHSEYYIHQTLRAIESSSGNLDPDTFFSEGSKAAALKAAGSAIDVALDVWEGRSDLGLALVRPPGHHAEKSRAAGFCIFNNIAVAAAALHSHGAKRIAVFDWDVHHGNGTQHQFQNRSDLLYISAHAWPHYPGSGTCDEIGDNEGRGFTVNIPFPHGATNGAYVALMDRLVAPVIREYAPDIILVSAGFDAHRNDMLGGMEVTEAGFAYMARIVRDLSREVCAGKVVLYLEGGYDLRGLADSMVEVLRVFDGAKVAKPEGTIGPRHEQILQKTIDSVSPFWRSLR